MASSPEFENRTVDDQYRLSDEQIETYEERGYLHLEGALDETTVDALRSDTAKMIEQETEEMQVFKDALEEAGSVDKEELEEASLDVLYDLEAYSSHFRDLIMDPRIITPVTDLISSNVEFTFSSLHAKPPERGNPFPMHQDSNFYPHETDDYVIALVHIGDAPPESGPLRFIEGSHEDGRVDGVDFQKPLPADGYPIDDSTEVPAEAGDVILFHYDTIHGSKLNRSSDLRPIVRLGYRDPENVQLKGTREDKIPLIVAGDNWNDD